GDDGFITDIPIGFTFTYFGEAKTSVSIASNGFISFGTDGLGTFMPLPFPNTATPNDTIGPLWADLDAGHGSPTISYQTIGPVGARRFIASWKDIPRLGLTDTNTFQVALFEGNNCIEFRYGQITPAIQSNTAVGLENSAGTRGVNVDPAALGN